MRILHVSTEPFAAEGRTYPTFFLAQGLQRLGHEVLILAPPGELAERLDDKGIGFRPLLKTPRERLIRPLKRVVRDWQPHLIHAGDLPVALSCLALGLPTVVSCDGEPRRSPAERHASLLFPRLIAPSEYHRRCLLQQSDLEPDQVAVVPESLDFDVYLQWVTLRASQNRPPLSEGLRLLYQPCASLPEEWTSVLEASYANARRGLHHQLLVATPPPHLLPDIEAQKRLINHELGYPLIDLLDPERTLESMLPWVDAVLGSGQTVLQALACEKPVIALRAGTLGGLITPRNVYGIEESRFEGPGVPPMETIVRAMESLLTRSPSVPRLTAEARELAQQIVEPRNVAQRTLAVYQACRRAWRSIGRLRRWYRRWRFR